MITINSNSIEILSSVHWISMAKCSINSGISLFLSFFLSFFPDTLWLYQLSLTVPSRPPHMFYHLVFEYWNPLWTTPWPSWNFPWMATWTPCQPSQEWLMLKRITLSQPTRSCLNPLLKKNKTKTKKKLNGSSCFADCTCRMWVTCGTLTMCASLTLALRMESTRITSLGRGWMCMCSTLASTPRM